ncbi:MAG TPA: 3-oxoacyl-[acyl-carrier-protein] synthase III C-terminal domain-containing protein [Pantanalinema sp.]
MQMRQTTVTKAPALAPSISIATYQSIPVLGLGTATPPSYSQADLFEQFGYTGNAFAAAIVAGASIDTRNFSAPIKDLLASATADTLGAYHREHAPRLAAEAVLKASGSSIDPRELDAVITATSTGYMMPGIAEVLCETYGIGSRSALRYDLVGQGCLAAFPAMQIARALIVSQQAKKVAVVCTEVQAALYNPAQDPNDKSVIVQQLLFGEGAGAIILAAEGDGESEQGAAYPSILDSQQELAPDSLNAVALKQGTVWEGLLDRAVPDIAGSVLPRVVERLLKRHGLSLAQVKHWAFHTGGRRVLEVCQGGLGLTDAQMAPSYEVLRLHGNMNSCSVLFSLDKLLAFNKPEAGDIGIMVAVGPGMTVGAFLVRWER